MMRLGRGGQDGIRAAVNKLLGRKGTTEPKQPTKSFLRRQASTRMLKFYVSPGRIADGVTALPTAPAAGEELNSVTFARGDKQLVFSDGSFRSPGRRRLRVTQNGQTTVLSGRQLRKMRKLARRAAKHQAQRAAVMAQAATT
jgi:hypothetical protein